jgi:hypothetical protein
MVAQKILKELVIVYLLKREHGRGIKLSSNAILYPQKQLQPVPPSKEGRWLQHA